MVKNQDVFNNERICLVDEDEVVAKKVAKLKSCFAKIEGCNTHLTMEQLDLMLRMFNSEYTKHY